MPSSDVWQKAGLSGMEAARLKRLLPLLQFAADFANAIVNLYVPAKTAGNYLLLAVERPHTLFFVSTPTSGAIMAAVEEPLIKYTFEAQKTIQGRREITADGTNRPEIIMFTFPILIGGKTAAVISLETIEATYRSENFGQIIKTAELFFAEPPYDYADNRYRSIGENDGVLITDRYDRVIFANLAAQRIYRVLGVGSPVGLMLTDRALTRHISRETVKPGQPDEKEIEAGGLILIMRNIPIEEAGSLKRRIVVIEDVTAIRGKEREIRLQKDVIREIHHRVKNNLQSIASLLNLQARRLAMPEAKRALKESAERVRSIAVIHEYLSNQGADAVDATSLVQNLLNNVMAMLPPNFVLIRRISGTTFLLPPEMVTSFALAINELLLNTIRHAFKDGRERGTIGLDVMKTETGCRLELFDDGCGLPSDFDLEKTASLGLTLIKNFLRDDLGGTFSLENREKKGTRAIITLPFRSH